MAALDFRCIVLPESAVRPAALGLLAISGPSASLEASESHFGVTLSASHHLEALASECLTDRARGANPRRTA